MSKHDGWAIVSPEGKVFVKSIRESRSEAIKGWGDTGMWSWWKRKGFHCARIKVSLV